MLLLLLANSATAVGRVKATTTHPVAAIAGECPAVRVASNNNEVLKLAIFDFFICIVNICDASLVLVVVVVVFYLLHICILMYAALKFKCCHCAMLLSGLCAPGLVR